LHGDTPRVPLRTCVGCRTVRPKSALVRLVQTANAVVTDPDTTLPGRGAYICPTPQCVTLVRRRDAAVLRRALQLHNTWGPQCTAALDELHDMVDYHRA